MSVRHYRVVSIATSLALCFDISKILLFFVLFFLFDSLRVARPAHNHNEWQAGRGAFRDEQPKRKVAFRLSRGT